MTVKRGARLRRIMAASLSALALCAGAGRAAAQEQDPAWTEPWQLSSAQSRASRATLVTDDYGHVHTFWSETYADRSPIIQYAAFDGQVWSSPIDIYVGIGVGNTLSFPTVVLDDEDAFHLVWVDSWSGSTYYTSAFLQTAGSARAWSEPLVIELPVHQPRLHVRKDGTGHIIYSSYWGEPPSLAPGIYYVRLNPETRAWTEPLWLDPDIREQEAPALLELAVDDWDGLHALWWYDNRDDPRAHDKRVRYANSLDGGYTWSAPRTIAVGTGEEDSTRVAGPILTIVGEQVHIVWAQGRLPYRVHMTSLDRGQTWGSPRRILGDLEGQAFDALMADSRGRLHFFGLLRFPNAVYHATWKSGGWSQPRLVYLLQRGPFDSYEGRIHAHNLNAAICAGNQLVITFTDPPSEENRGLYTMHRTLDDMEPQSILPIPTRPERSESPTPTATLTPTESAARTSSTARAPVVDAAPGDPPSSPAGPSGVVAAAAAGALAVVGTTAVLVCRRR